jgi:hypothetical protein
MRLNHHSHHLSPLSLSPSSLRSLVVLSTKQQMHTPPFRTHRLHDIITLPLSDHMEVFDTKEQPTFSPLPRDIMVMILEDVLLADNDTINSPCFYPSYWPWFSKRKCTLHPEILQTCKDLSSLGLAVFYGCNELSFESVSWQMMNWLKIIRRTNAAQVTKLSRKGIFLRANVFRKDIEFQFEQSRCRQALPSRSLLGYNVSINYKDEAHVDVMLP